MVRSNRLLNVAGAAVIACAVLSLSAFAGVGIGAKAPGFALPDVSGKVHSLAQYLDNKYVVVMFIATQCPVSNAYNDRMAKLYADYASKGIAFVGINSNRQESVEEVAQHSKAHGFLFPVLKDEANRVFRSRVVNPKWIEAIQQHGYKGALEVAATVDYLFGYDATAQVVDDWQYEQVAQSYLLDPTMQAFFARSNPWAMKDVAERLLEAIQRGMWAAPTDETRAAIEQAFLEAEGNIEGGRPPRAMSEGAEG